MKELVILSGKGGTGKTSISAAFAHLVSESNPEQNPVLVDADVDASNLQLVLKPSVIDENEFRSSSTAVIDQGKCESCGICTDVCRYKAVEMKESKYQIDPIACEGCKSCVYQCPYGAIHLEIQLDGYWYHSQSRFGHLFHAHLLPARENSGKLVTLVKQHGRLFAREEGAHMIVVDGPPGIGCPVIAAVSGADLALIIVEPTLSGIHDMQRILQTVDHFGIKAIVCINKADINIWGVEQIEKYCQDNEIEVVGRIRFDKIVTEAMVNGEPVTAYNQNSDITREINSAWIRVRELLLG